MKITIGALAHVDAGKTTLSESILYKVNVIRNKGRVDNKNSYLDFNEIEKEKGITIFNSQANFSYKNKEYIYIDTPGHTDLEYESNRAVRVLDCAILLISAIEDIPVDTIKKFNYLLDFHIPIILFINKMDISNFSEDDILKVIKDKLSIDCVKHTEINEHISLNNEELLDYYLNNNSLNKKDVVDALKENRVFPCFFGSALKDECIDDLLDFIYDNIDADDSSDNDLNAYVYKISNDYTYIKVLSGILENKTVFGNNKINEMYEISGSNLYPISKAIAGDIVAVKGLKDISIGTYLPSFNIDETICVPNLTYRIISKLDSNDLFKKSSSIINEFPELNIHISNNNLFIQLNGELHAIIVKKIFKQKLDIDVDFSDPIIKYRETINEETIGVGHFEPLRHYAEVVVKLKPSEKFSVSSAIDNKYISSILSYLKTYPIKGILTNSPLINFSIQILDIKTHPKHTEGHDLIEATRRAIRQGLSKIQSTVLEPCYITTINTNDSNSDIIISYLTSLKLTFTIENNNLFVSIPLKIFNSTITNLKSKLKGNINYSIDELIYVEADNQQEIIETINYDYRKDLRNPSGSIFCKQGAGHYIEPEDVESNMHLNIEDYIEKKTSSNTYNRIKISDDELKRVWNTIYKPRPRYIPTLKQKQEERIYKPKQIKPLMYMIDGYNLMYRLNEELAINDFINARENVINLVCDYAGYVQAEVILVFDAYISNGIECEVSKFDNITIVYTKGKQTADTYIEQKSKELQNEYKIIVVTSDNLEQLRVFANNSSIISSSEFLKRYDNFKKNNTRFNTEFKNRPFEELKTMLEE